MHHCKSCWDNHHNGLRDLDWLSKEEYDKTYENLKDIVEKFRKKHLNCSPSTHNNIEEVGRKD